MQKSRKMTSKTSSTSTRPVKRPSARAASRSSSATSSSGPSSVDRAPQRLRPSAARAARCRSRVTRADLPPPKEIGRETRRARRPAASSPSPVSAEISKLLVDSPGCFGTESSRSTLLRTIHDSFAITSCRDGAVRSAASSTHSTRSAAAARSRARRTPSCSTGSWLSRTPAVSSKRHRIAAEIEMHLDHVARGPGVAATRSRPRAAPAGSAGSICRHSAAPRSPPPAPRAAARRDARPAAFSQSLQAVPAQHGAPARPGPRARPPRRKNRCAPRPARAPRSAAAASPRRVCQARPDTGASPGARCASVSAKTRSARPSTAVRSIRPFSNARRVNSPASAGRNPGSLPSSCCTAAIIARPPCRCSSTMSSPVSVFGPGNHSTSASSSTAFVCRIAQPAQRRPARLGQFSAKRRDRIARRAARSRAPPRSPPAAGRRRGRRWWGGRAVPSFQYGFSPPDITEPPGHEVVLRCRQQRNTIGT